MTGLSDLNIHVLDDLLKKNDVDGLPKKRNDVDDLPKKNDVDDLPK
jgi:hypothetical protein